MTTTTATTAQSRRQTVSHCLERIWPLKRGQVGYFLICDLPHQPPSLYEAAFQNWDDFVGSKSVELSEAERGGGFNVALWFDAQRKRWAIYLTTYTFASECLQQDCAEIRSLPQLREALKRDIRTAQDMRSLRDCRVSQLVLFRY